MKSLTSLLGHLTPAARLQRRRRIYAMADRQAALLLDKYGDREMALAACRRRQLATTAAPAALRNHVWGRVAQILKAM